MGVKLLRSGDKAHTLNDLSGLLVSGEVIPLLSAVIGFGRDEVGSVRWYFNFALLSLPGARQEILPVQDCPPFSSLTKL